MPSTEESTDTRSGVSWFFVAVDPARARRPADVLMAGFGALLIFLTALGSKQISWLAETVDELVASVPTWMDVVFGFAYAFGALYALVIVGMALSQVRSRADLVRDIALTLLLVVIIVIVLARIVGESWPMLIPELSSQIDPVYPVLRVAAVASILAVAGPQLVRPMRRLGWFVIVILFLGAIGLRVGVVFDALGGLGVGLLSAGVVLVIFGSTSGFPTEAEVRNALAALGVSVSDLGVAERQAWGARQFDAVAGDGEALHVRVYGRDATDAQIITRWWRSIWYRDAGPSLTSSRLHQVDHEALMTMIARRMGVQTPTVVAVGEASKKMALIVMTAAGRSTDEVDDSEIDDGMMIDVWRSVALLHDGGIAHGRLNAHAIRFTADGPGLGDFHHASTAAPNERIQGDVAELLAASANGLGTEQAVTYAKEGLGTDALAAALPYIQRSAVSSEGRADIPPKKSYFSDIREEVALQTGAEAPEPVQLTRFTWKTVGTFLLTLLAGYALIGSLADIDFAAVWEELQDADWAWIVLALIAATATLWTDAFAMIAANTVPLPLLPTVNLQSAIKFIQLAIGGAAGRMATNVSYLRKFGVSTTASVTQGGVDSFTGFVVQSTILLLAVTVGNVDLIPDDVTADANWVMVLAVVAVAVVVSVLMVRYVPAIRERVIPPAKEMWAGLKSLGSDPSRLIQLFGANTASQILFALSLWLTAFAFGWTISLMSAVVIYIAMALLSGILPIPGGVGVSEGVLTAGLTAVGVDEAAAFAIAVTFRVASAYLPPVWGWFSLQWLQRNEYL